MSDEPNSVRRSASRVPVAMADKAVFSVCELLALLFGLPFGDHLYHSQPITGWHYIYLGIAVLFAVGGPMWPWIRTRAWVSPRVSASVSRAASDARVWLIILLLLFIYGAGRVDGRLFLALGAVVVIFFLTTEALARTRISRSKMLLTGIITVVAALVAGAVGAGIIYVARSEEPKITLPQSSNSTDAAATKLTEALQQQLDTERQARQALESQLATTTQQLEAARHAPPVAPQATAPPKPSPPPPLPALPNQDKYRNDETKQLLGKVLERMKDILTDEVQPSLSAVSQWSGRPVRFGMMDTADAIDAKLAAVRNSINAVLGIPRDPDNKKIATELEHVLSPPDMIRPPLARLEEVFTRVKSTNYGPMKSELALTAVPIVAEIYDWVDRSLRQIENMQRELRL
jgi:hypothetical protein